MKDINYSPLFGKSLLEDFKVDAGWVELKDDVDPRVDEDNFKFGTLNYHNGMIDLSLFQSWTGLKKVTLDTPLERKQKVFGNIASVNNKYIYIPEIVGENSLDDPLLLSVTKRTWYTTAFSILNFIPKENEKFNYLILNFADLDNWMTPVKPLIHYKDELKFEQNAEQLLCSYKYKEFTFTVYVVDHINIKHDENNRKVEFDNNSCIRIESESDNGITTENSIYFSREFRKMLSTILGYSTNTTQISKRGFDKNNKLISEDIYNFEQRFSKTSEIMLPLIYKDKQDVDFSKLILNWFDMSESCELLIQNYLMTIEK